MPWVSWLTPDNITESINLFISDTVPATFNGVVTALVLAIFLFFFLYMVRFVVRW